jgi:hypothetical protein
MLTISSFVEQIMQYGLEYFKVYHGLYRGVVTDNKDPEERGRIRARIPQAGISTALETWIKPSQDGSGVNRGSFWPPEVGDTVFVSFAQGNPARPELYVGGWYSYPNDVTSVADEFAYTNEKPETRGFATRLGHVLLFSDEDGNERVELKWHRADSADAAKTDETATADRTTGEAATLSFKPDGSIELKDINESTILLDGTNQQIFVQDVNENKVVTTEGGIEIQDLAENKIVMDASDKSITVTDANSNTVLLDDAGIRVTDKHGNEVVLNRNGAEIKSSSVKIGDGADSPAMRHRDWYTWAVNHTHPTAVGNSGPPITPPTQSIASQVVKVK